MRCKKKIVDACMTLTQTGYVNTTYEVSDTLGLPRPNCLRPKFNAQDEILSLRLLDNALAYT